MHIPTMITKGKSIWTIKRHFSGGYFPKRRRRSYLTTQYGPKLGLQGVKIYSCFMAYVLCRNPRICFGLHCCSYFYFFFYQNSIVELESRGVVQWLSSSSIIVIIQISFIPMKLTFVSSYVNQFSVIKIWCKLQG